MSKIKDTSEVVVLLKDVWVQYNHHIVLKRINLKINRKEIVSIVGPNGGGKTTLLYTILGFKLPFKGKVIVLGKTPQKIQKAGVIGYIPQSNQFESHFPINVRDVVTMSRYGVKKFGERLSKEDRELTEEALEKVKMSGYKNHYFGSLSGGQKQLVLIARAMALKPEILILDEPSTGLDTVAQSNFYSMLREIRDKENITIILVSHDIGTVSGIVDQIACLNKQIHFHGKPEDCIPSKALEKVFGKNIQFLIHDNRCTTCEKIKC
jgi:zinc transport system ATP-binding protein